MDSTEICYMPAVEMVEAIKTRKLSPVEIMDAVLDRIERLNPKVNAYCTVVAESARKQAKEAETMVVRGEELGPLHGIPIAIKDLMFTKGIRTTFGSKVYENFIPQQDSVICERLKAAGGIIVGKTNLPEFALCGSQTENWLFGTTRNPWNLERSPGGSSGGSVVAVASGMGPLSIGSDGSGSVRMPASFCGVFGLKPSFGRVPRYPDFPAGWETYSCSGTITRTVKDTALMMEVIAGRDDRDRYSLPDTGLRYLPLLGADLKGLKIAWGKDLYANVDSEVLKVTEASVKTFEALGATVEIASPKVRNPEWSFATITELRVKENLSELRVKEILQDKPGGWREQMHPNLVLRIEGSKDIPATEYAKALRDQMAYWDEIRPFFEKYDLLLTPTAAIPPPELGKWAIEEIAGVKVTPRGWLSFVFPFNITGQPAASVPCGWTADGLPIGLQIVGRRFDDATVLKAAAAFEQAAPWADRRPPLD